MQLDTARISPHLNMPFLFYFDSCNADVGRKGGRQKVSLGTGCVFKSVVVHEIGHVIGFWHEQNRPDRDDYVHVFKDNILDGNHFPTQSNSQLFH